MLGQSTHNVGRFVLFVAYWWQTRAVRAKSKYYYMYCSILSRIPRSYLVNYFSPLTHCCCFVCRPVSLPFPSSPSPYPRTGIHGSPHPISHGTAPKAIDTTTTNTEKKNTWRDFLWETECLLNPGKNPGPLPIWEASWHREWFSSLVFVLDAPGEWRLCKLAVSKRVCLHGTTSWMLGRSKGKMSVPAGQM